MVCLFAVLLSATGIGQDGNSALTCSSESEKEVCYQELIACVNSSEAGVYRAEILAVVLDCGFSSLALEVRDAESDPVIRQYLNIQLLDHRIETGQSEEAAELIDSIPDPDYGRAKVAESYAMRGEFRSASEITCKIVSPRTRSVEWFRLAALASSTERNLSDFAMEQGQASLKLLDPFAEAHRTEPLAMYVIAQIQRTPNTSPSQIVEQLCKEQGESLREGVYDELLKQFSSSADSVHFEQMADEMLRRYLTAVEQRSSRYSILDETLVYRLDGFGASLVRAGSRVEKKLPEVLCLLELDRTFTERLADQSEAELAQNLAQAIQATDGDQWFSDKVCFEAIDELMKRDKFESAFELIHHLHKPAQALVRIASHAGLSGEDASAAEAVRQWESCCLAFDENVFENAATQELIPVLVRLEKKSILDRMLSASHSSEQILKDAQLASNNGGLVNMITASNKLAAAISLAQALAGVGQREAAEQLMTAVSRKLEIVQVYPQADLATRLSRSTLDSLGISGATALLNANAPSEVRDALINEICYAYGLKHDKASFDIFLATVATPREAVAGRLSFVKGLVKDGACAK